VKACLRTKNLRQEVALYNSYVDKEKSSPTEYYCSLDAWFSVGEVQIMTIQSKYKRISSLGFENFGNCFSHCTKSSVFVEPESEIKHRIPLEASHYSSVLKILPWNSMAHGKNVPVAHTASLLAADKTLCNNPSSFV
jgi:hypothetical protein